MRRARARVIALLVCLSLAALLLAGCGGGQSYPYVASKMSTRFHKPSCPWAAQIHDKDKIGFKTRDEAVKAGYEPDPNCNP